MGAGFARVEQTSYSKPDGLRPSVLLRIAEQRLWSMFSYISEEGRQAGMQRLRELMVETDDAPVQSEEMHLLMTAEK